MKADPTARLVIFDCDGVLVDSEALENQLLVDMAARHGVLANAAEAHVAFVGKKLADCVSHMERAAAMRLPDTFIEDYRAELRVVVETQLKPVAGIRAALEEIAIAKCVASNGPRAKIEQALRVTGLTPFFGERLFSAYEIDAWKPAPDLFLHAARTLGFAPSQCTVIEDSRSGVEAALAAGMRVFAYAPNGERHFDVPVFDQMAQLPRLLSA